MAETNPQTVKKSEVTKVVAVDVSPTAAGAVTVDPHDVAVAEAQHKAEAEERAKDNAKVVYRGTDENDTLGGSSFDYGTRG